MSELSSDLPTDYLRLRAEKVATLSASNGASPGDSYGLLSEATVVIERVSGTISWVGPCAALPPQFADAPEHDFGAALITPGLIDCHTHLVYGGHRAREFELRLEGASYEEVARAGGGILSTVRATRAASEAELMASAQKRVNACVAQGVTTIEIKSGYGLTVADELKMLRVARRLGGQGDATREAGGAPIHADVDRSVDVRVEPEPRSPSVLTSWLAAHALPPEYIDRRDAYLDDVVIAGLRVAHDDALVDMVDGFCEGIAFSPSEIARVFDVAKELGFPVRLHAEQLSNVGGAALAASYGATSADHLEYLDETGIAAMAQAGTVAVLLPGAYYTLRETQAPPVAALRAAGVPIAIATDANPGSSPLFAPLLAMNMACTLFRLTPAEALAGMTREAARALGLTDRGVLAAGLRADIAVWDVTDPAELAYRIGDRPLISSFIAGQP